MNILLLFFFIAWGQISYGLDDPRDLVQSEVRLPKRPDRLARVRMAIILTPYEKFLIRTPSGASQETYRPVTPIKHHLRARIEKTNHFYIDKWHIETIPESWDREKRQLAMKVRFYHRYGDESNMEEALGTTEVMGTLEGDHYLYSFIGTKTIRFNHVLGHPLLDIVLGTPQSAPPTLSTKNVQNSEKL